MTPFYDTLFETLPGHFYHSKPVLFWHILGQNWSKIDQKWPKIDTKMYQFWHFFWHTLCTFDAKIDPFFGHVILMTSIILTLPLPVVVVYMLPLIFWVSVWKRGSKKGHVFCALSVFLKPQNRYLFSNRRSARRVEVTKNRPLLGGFGCYIFKICMYAFCHIRHRCILIGTSKILTYMKKHVQNRGQFWSQNWPQNGQFWPKMGQIWPLPNTPPGPQKGRFWLLFDIFKITLFLRICIYSYFLGLVCKHMNLSISVPLNSSL